MKLLGFSLSEQAPLTEPSKLLQGLEMEPNLMVNLFSNLKISILYCYLSSIQRARWVYHFGRRSCTSGNSIGLCFRVKDQSLYKFNPESRGHNLIQRNYDRRIIICCSSKSILLIKRPKQTKPWNLKPDIIGPGVSILTAYPFRLDNDIATRTKSMFNIMSGTSMPCPHLSGIAALLKSSHPDWSPAAIKPAIMTTADVVNHHGKPIVDEKPYPTDVFAIGAGHLNPSKANDPGLVYDIQPDDYIAYLCGLNYMDKQVEVITKRSVKCSKVESIVETQLNYPSFSVVLGSESLIFIRTVTNVGDAKSTYTLEKSVPSGIDITVIPEKLVFKKVEVQVKGPHGLGVYKRYISPLGAGTMGSESKANLNIEVNHRKGRKIVDNLMIK
ncbi:hypothetical protein FEM48_Zijuj12G0115400 [Ziziphus jujuba var. spinosa]|uniref:Uncharacterized protein n=1 Tax=Ziziphus jujuba var. spinosa TaxID=714518 RepID=A0A978UD26_ZIZJJ|nr:hypothetical protein FEM48_Zijuj12G0115400 [Ziziphus jujuba var. spinosa]